MKSGFPPVAVSQGGAEGRVRLQAVQRAREHGDRGGPQRPGADRGGLRVGDQLRDERRIAALALGRPGCGGDQQRHPSSRRVR